MAPAALVRQLGSFPGGGWTVGLLSQPESSGRHGGGVSSHTTVSRTQYLRECHLGFLDQVAREWRGGWEVEMLAAAGDPGPLAEEAIRAPGQQGPFGGAGERSMPAFRRRYPAGLCSITQNKSSLSRNISSGQYLPVHLCALGGIQALAITCFCFSLRRTIHSCP
jgi:hypothetical protein